MTLYRITTSWMCCGALVDKRGVVIQAAPIIAWAVGKHISRLEHYVERVGGTTTT